MKIWDIFNHKEKLNKVITCCLLLVILGFLVTLLPIGYLTFVNRASGDDYGYGWWPHLAWVNTGSLLEVIREVGNTIRLYYDGWQGTWFSIFLFALQPEVFSDKAYVIVAPLMTGLWIWGTTALLEELLVKIYGFERKLFWAIDLLFLLICMQFIPGTKSSFFWFNGAAHYMIPYVMCLLVAVQLLRFVRQGKKRNLICLIILMGLLGGSNYQAALLALILSVTTLGIGLFFKGDISKKSVWLLVPIAIEMIGLVISMKAPGNEIRSGRSLNPSLGELAGTVGQCFYDGTVQIGTYLQEKPAVFLLMVLVGLAVGVGFRTSNRQYESPKWYTKCMIILYTFCVYCAMFAPVIYADVEYSQGVTNTIYLVFLWMLLIDMFYLGSGMQWKYLQKIWIPICSMCLLLICLIGKQNIKESTFFICMDYITTGQAADYKEQMDLQTSILQDPSVEDAVIPFINDQQGPLMQMPATGDPTRWTNTVMSEFYNKSSVTAIDRSEWEHAAEK